MIEIILLVICYIAGYFHGNHKQFVAKQQAINPGRFWRNHE